VCPVASDRVSDTLGGSTFALSWRPRRWHAQLERTILETPFQLGQIGFAIVASLLAFVRRRISHVGVHVALGGDVVSPVGDEVAPLGRPFQLIEFLDVTHPEPLLADPPRHPGTAVCSRVVVAAP
jgi:hypothetical protein